MAKSKFKLGPEWKATIGLLALEGARTLHGMWKEWNDRRNAEREKALTGNAGQSQPEPEKKRWVNFLAVSTMCIGAWSVTIQLMGFKVERP